MNTYQETTPSRFSDGASTGAWWQPAKNDRIECLLCPRKCNLKDGDRGFCFVRQNRGGEMALTAYGKSTGFCIDPIEKKPLNHFYPGTPVLSFGTAGCNLGCKFCQNWDISKSREIERLSSSAEPEAIANAAKKTGCKSVAYTYNDPIVWAEYAIDTAKACTEQGIQNVAVTAGYITEDAREEFFSVMDAANVDLKAFTENFYRKTTYSSMQPVLDTLRYLHDETDIWFEITNLLIPGSNDKADELRKMCDWIVETIGDLVPIHFTAFHPDFKMLDRPRTNVATLIAAQEIAISAGIQYAYVGNVQDADRQSTKCHHCKQLLVDRYHYELGRYNINQNGTCKFCQGKIPGRFQAERGDWGAKRQPIRIDSYAPSYVPPLVQIKEMKSKDDIVSNAPEPQPTPQPQSQAVNPTPMKLLEINRLKDEQKKSLSQAAAHWLAAAVYGEQTSEPIRMIGDLADMLVMGAFVTAKRGDILRGCCGVLGKPMPLGHVIASAAYKTAKEDKRMAALSLAELPYLDIDLTLLGPFVKMQAQGAARQDNIEIGKHGLMIQKGQKNGLLLPSVAVDRGWTPFQFLQGVCNKAGLSVGDWESPDTDVFTFDGTAMGGKLSDLVEQEISTQAAQPLTQEQLQEYAKIVGQNIVALVSGGTPSYVIPHLPDVTVNALVISLQWGVTPESSEEPTNLRQGNLLQVSFRPGVPLQNSLYQMCQQAAMMFRQQQFAGQMQVGLSIGVDPAMHGYGLKADLEGVDAQRRAVVISDRKHCGLAYHPAQTADELRDKLRSLLPISSRDATVHSVQIMSTMPHVISISAPSPTRQSGMRPPAVAGKFYPAEDAARRAMVGTFFKDEDPPQVSPAAIMVPHAGIKYSGRIAAKVWRSIKAPEARTMIVISPKHTEHGINWSVCPFDSWQVSKTTSIQGDAQLAEQLAAAVAPLELDSAAHQLEHGIEVQLPILERVAPDCKVVGLALHGGSWEDISSAAAEFADFLKTLPEMPLLVISSDMNHYAPDAENRRRDRIALDAMAAKDPHQLLLTCQENEISMCGVVPAAFVMETLRQLDVDYQVQEVEYATSADVSGDRTRVVGYAGTLLT
ncbi:MAG: AmmeMemoRadiSam system radical SAM enzyme [Planctomycetota bacterium]